MKYKDSPVNAFHWGTFSRRACAFWNCKVYGSLLLTDFKMCYLVCSMIFSPFLIFFLVVMSQVLLDKSTWSSPEILGLTSFSFGHLSNHVFACQLLESSVFTPFFHFQFSPIYFFIFYLLLFFMCSYLFFYLADVGHIVMLCSTL